jgi:hypothetical protein
MPPRKSGPLTGGHIVDAARKRIGSMLYKTYAFSNDTLSGEPKDHHFVADALDDVGLGFGDRLSKRPHIVDWADANSNIPGWTPVNDGTIQAGDILATPKRIPLNWMYGGGQQLAIAAGNGKTIGITDNDRVGESDFGLQDGHSPTVWRSAQLADGDIGEAGDTGDDGVNTQQIADLFKRYADPNPWDFKCRQTGTCENISS